MSGAGLALRVGDKRRATALAIVAVLALAFVAYQLFAALGGGRPPISSVPPSPAKPPEVASLLDLPDELLGNPFSHPKLSEKSAPRPRPEPQPQAPDGGVLPFRTEFGELDSGAQITRLPGVGTPANNAVTSRQPTVGAQPALVLRAVVRADESVAFISVNGEESMPYKVGELIAPGVRLVAIEDDSVSIRTKNGVTALRMGGDQK